jgi:hypothetical protein
MQTVLQFVKRFPAFDETQVLTAVFPTAAQCDRSTPATYAATPPD